MTSLSRRVSAKGLSGVVVVSGVVFPGYNKVELVDLRSLKGFKSCPLRSSPLADAREARLHSLLTSHHQDKEDVLIERPLKKIKKRDRSRHHGLSNTGGSFPVSIPVATLLWRVPANSSTTGVFRLPLSHTRPTIDLGV